MFVTTIFIIFACVCVAGPIASLICYSINPDLGDIIANISFVALLALVVIGLIGSMADPSQENIAKIQQTAADNAAIYTIQIIENDGSISFEYRGNADVEVQPERITLYDGDEMWTVFKNQDSTLVIESPK